MNAFFYTCQKATELIEKRNVVPLTIVEKVRLKAHLSMCAACHAYSHQSELLDTMLKKQNDSSSPKKEISAAARARILEALQKK